MLAFLFNLCYFKSTQFSLRGFLFPVFDRIHFSTCFPEYLEKDKAMIPGYPDRRIYYDISEL